MTDRGTFRDEEITAYLDGQADAALTERLDAALTQDKNLRTRMQALRIDRDALASRFDELLREAPVVPNLSPRRLVGWQRWAVAACIAVAAFAAGVSVDIPRETDRVETWQDFATAYHALYGEETLSGIATTQEGLDAQLARASALLGTRLDRPMLEAEGLELVRAQVLTYKGAPLIQISYLDGDRQPLALCIMRGDDAQSLAQSKKFGVAQTLWSEGGLEYALLGEVDRAVAEGLASRL